MRTRFEDTRAPPAASEPFAAADLRCAPREEPVVPIGRSEA